MSTLKNATPRPWKVLKGHTKHPDRPYQIISVATGDPVTRWGTTFITPALDTGKANAALIVEAVNSFEALTAERDALKVENERLHADREALWYWIRHPDWADEFSQRDLLKWLDKRPSHLTRPLREETAEREKTARAAIKW